MTDAGFIGTSALNPLPPMTGPNSTTGGSGTMATDHADSGSPDSWMIARTSAGAAESFNAGVNWASAQPGQKTRKNKNVVRAFRVTS
jgi:hypothetical protein